MPFPRHLGEVSTLERATEISFCAGNRYTNKFSKIFKELQPGEGEYPGKLKVGIRYTNRLRRSCENCVVGKRNIRETSELKTVTPTPHIKVSKCEIFDLLDFRDF